MSESSDVVVYQGEHTEAYRVKLALELAGIKVWLGNEHTASYANYLGVAGNIGLVSVIISRQDLDAARTAWEEWETNNHSSGSEEETEGAHWVCPNCQEHSEAHFALCWNCQTPQPENYHNRTEEQSASRPTVNN